MQGGKIFHVFAPASAPGSETRPEPHPNSRRRENGFSPGREKVEDFATLKICSERKIFLVFRNLPEGGASEIRNLYCGRRTTTDDLIARVACSCEILVKNRLEPARPAGRPRAKHHKGMLFEPLFLKCEKWTFSELMPSSIADFKLSFFMRTATRALRGAFSSMRVYGAPRYL